MVWKPRVTVAVIVEQGGHFLMVEEQVDEGVRFNQPAGHLETGESLLQAATRECLEETAWHFQPQALVGVYRWRSPDSDDTFLRATFCGRCVDREAARQLDPEIAAVHWLTAEEIRGRAAQLRSPLVLASLDDYLRGKRHPLDVLVDLD
ncbi:MAG: NUDIX hydrolase [Gammaproteobacteria bacterium]|jgi:8-oxo-dGTP pyrophosphatase MutT (NUDIX family)